jgi:putative transposase
MPSSFTNLTYHIVFSTKYRKPWLTDDIRTELFDFLRGVIAKRDGKLLEIGGTEDHIHIVTSCSPKMALADFVRDLKAGSSKWMHEDKRHLDFEWQTGYGAFTVSHSQVDIVRKYAGNQQEHHRQLSFEDEFRAILQRHGITFDEQYLFEDEDRD